MKPQFYRVEDEEVKGNIIDSYGNLIDPTDRGLDGECEDTGKPHKWLLYPKWSDCVKTGGKDYLMCLNCGEHSHL